MTKHRRLVLLAALALTGTVACGDDAAEPEGASPGACAPTELRYESFGRPFFDSYCTGCHSSTLKGRDRKGAPEGYNWDRIESVREHSCDIADVAAAGPDGVNEFMPFGDYPAPSDGERFDLGAWLACGAP
jgi:hypothetical protein